MQNKSKLITKITYTIEKQNFVRKRHEITHFHRDRGKNFANIDIYFESSKAITIDFKESAYGAFGYFGFNQRGKK